jgi:hypothetical protein
MIGTNTPLFAKTLSWKYAHLPSQRVQEDLEQNHFRNISRSHIQAVSYLVGEKILDQETAITYHHGIKKESVQSVSVGIDGAMLKLTDGNYREAMVGTLSLIGAKREVLHTIYLGDQPEHGKEGFGILMSNEIAQLKSEFGHLPWSAVADGAKHNWTFLEKHVQTQIIDWWHAWEYIRAGFREIYAAPKVEEVVKKWDTRLKEEEKSVLKLLKLFKKYDRKLKKEQKPSQILEKTVTYLSNHHHQMNYASYLEQGVLIGSGVTESACKTLIKNRLCGCGMEWEEGNTRLLILNRSLTLTNNRWNQAWKAMTKTAA